MSTISYHPTTIAARLFASGTTGKCTIDAVDNGGCALNLFITDEQGEVLLQSLLEIFPPENPPEPDCTECPALEECAGKRGVASPDVCPGVDSFAPENPPVAETEDNAREVDPTEPVSTCEACSFKCVLRTAMYGAGPLDRCPMMLNKTAEWKHNATRQVDPTTCEHRYYAPISRCVHCGRIRSVAETATAAVAADRELNGEPVEIKLWAAANEFAFEVWPNSPPVAQRIRDKLLAVCKAMEVKTDGSK